MHVRGEQACFPMCTTVGVVDDPDPGGWSGLDRGAGIESLLQQDILAFLYYDLAHSRRVSFAIALQVCYELSATV